MPATHVDLIFNFSHLVHHVTYHRWPCGNHFTRYAVIFHTMQTILHIALAYGDMVSEVPVISHTL